MGTIGSVLLPESLYTIGKVVPPRPLDFFLVMTVQLNSKIAAAGRLVFVCHEAKFCYNK